MIFLTAIFFGLSIISILDFVNTRYKNLIYTLIGITLFCIAVLRPPAIDRDYTNYVRLFNLNLTLNQYLIEPSFVLISLLIHKLLSGNSFFLFCIYALIGVSIKLIAIKRLSRYCFLSLLFYFSYSFIIHEITQIRAGVSAGFILLCIPSLYERKGLKFLLFAFLAIFFHYSAVMVLFLWFLNPDKINTTFYRFLIISSYLIFFFTKTFFFTDILNFFPEWILINKFIKYESENGQVMNVFNLWQILRCILCFIFLSKIDLIRQNNKYGIVVLKIYIWATISFVLLASNPTIAGRISDLFSIVDIIMLPCLMSIISPRIAAIGVLILISFSYLVLNLFFNKII